MKKPSKIKWEKPQLVILMRDPEMAAGDLHTYVGLVASEIDVNPCEPGNNFH